jgi:hypothetical protein
MASSMNLFIPGVGSVRGNFVADTSKKKKVSKKKSRKGKKEHDEERKLEIIREKKEYENLNLGGRDLLVKRMCVEGVDDSDELYQSYQSFKTDCHDTDKMKELYDSISNFRKKVGESKMTSCGNQYLNDKMLDFLTSCGSPIEVFNKEKKETVEQIVERTGKHRDFLHNILISSLISNNYDGLNSARIARLTHDFSPEGIATILEMSIEESLLFPGEKLSKRIVLGINNSLVPLFSRFVDDKLYDQYMETLPDDLYGFFTDMSKLTRDVEIKANDKQVYLMISSFLQNFYNSDPDATYNFILLSTNLGSESPLSLVAQDFLNHKEEEEEDDDREYIMVE